MDRMGKGNGVLQWKVARYIVAQKIMGVLWLQVNTGVGK